MLLPLLPVFLFGGLAAAVVSHRKTSRRSSASDWEIFREEWFRHEARGDRDAQNRMLEAMFDPDGGHILSGTIFTISKRSDQRSFIREQLMESYADVTPTQQDLLLFYAFEHEAKFSDALFGEYRSKYIDIINRIRQESGLDPYYQM